MSDVDSTTGCNLKVQNYEKYNFIHFHNVIYDELCNA